MVLFAVTLVERDENPKIVLSWRHFDTSAGKLGGNLVEASRRDAFFWTVDVEG
jgi:hypothetical protein